jgi:hypothetical protein
VRQKINNLLYMYGDIVYPVALIISTLAVLAIACLFRDEHDVEVV